MDREQAALQRLIAAWRADGGALPPELLAAALRHARTERSLAFRAMVRRLADRLRRRRRRGLAQPILPAGQPQH